jgi:hypothetical protein
MAGVRLHLRGIEHLGLDPELRLELFVVQACIATGDSGCRLTTGLVKA